MTRLLQPGEAAPWFRASTLEGNGPFAFDSTAGRFVVLMFAGTAGHAPTAEALRVLAAHHDLFDDERACFFGVTSDPKDAATGRIAKQIPGIRWFLDYDRAIARQFGAADDGQGYRAHWLLCDPSLRVMARAPIHEGEIILRRLGRLLMQPMPELPAPVLIVPNVFEPELCRHLITLYESHGGSKSGFMRQVDGVTVGVHDESFKRRSDYYLDDHAELCAGIRDRFIRRLVPQLQRVFQFDATRIERYVVACYDGDGGGYFRPHRDNTTAGTAHRRFACSINLNAEEFEGGDLRFPEFGSTRYRPPTGGAAVFSCSLLHEATPVTRGRRYAYLPFFYDEAGAKIREGNAKPDLVAPELANYRA